MATPALNIPLSLPEKDEYQITVTVRSNKHDCNTSYILQKHEIENYHMYDIIRFMTGRLTNFIKEKQNAISEGKESENS